MIGETYYERGEPVRRLVMWNARSALRNCVIQRADGTVVCRPFRGLRKNPPKARA